MASTPPVPPLGFAADAAYDDIIQAYMEDDA